MSITVQLDLPEDVAEKARAAGLLDCQRLSAILEEAVERDRQAKEFIAILDQIRAQSGEPMSMEEIQAEVDAVRAAARNGREAGT